MGSPANVNTGSGPAALPWWHVGQARCDPSLAFMWAHVLIGEPVTVSPGHALMATP
jgi:hypothetical protein